MLAAVLAIAGQLGLSSASLTLARDESSAVSHTERSGIDLHHGHNEATCAACATLSFQATVTSAAPPVPGERTAGLVLARAAERRIAGPRLLSNTCRAPPREV